MSHSLEECFQIIESLPRKLARAEEYMHLAGIVPEDYDATERPYDEAIRILKHTLERIEMLKNHTHQWNDDDYCDICGADGRA